jgi:hypothetical protein
LEAERIYLRAKLPADADNKLVGIQPEDMQLPIRSSMNQKWMAEPFTSFVDDLHSIHLILGVDVYRYYLVVLGEDIVGKFMSPNAAGGSTFSCDHHASLLPTEGSRGYDSESLPKRCPQPTA